LCIGDLKAVKQALNKFDPDEEMETDLSAIGQIITGDKIRK